MKLAIIGSRKLNVTNLDDYIPPCVTEIVSGGAQGIDSLAAEYAKRNNIPLVEFKPDYKQFHKGAPLKRNHLIAQYADEAIAFWDGTSKGTLYTINLFKQSNKKITIIKL